MIASKARILQLAANTLLCFFFSIAQLCIKWENPCSSTACWSSTALQVIFGSSVFRARILS